MHTGEVVEVELFTLGDWLGVGEGSEVTMWVVVLPCSPVKRDMEWV